ncbi:MAG: hypothetical protein AB1896_15070 [Thermodesulfobacteriota bacterium]
MIKIGMLVQGGEEIVWYGCEIPRPEREYLLTRYESEGAIEILRACDDNFSGPRVRDVEDFSRNDLTIKWCFHEDEDVEELGDDRLVALGRTNVVIRRPGRKKCPEGYVYLCGGEARPGYRDYRYFETGFLPPFKPEDVTLFLDDLGDFGFDGYILSRVSYVRQDPAYQETDLRLGRRLPSKFLED